VLQVDSDSDDSPTPLDDILVEDATLDPGVRRKGKHGLLQYLRSNVSQVINHLSADYEKRAPLHETLYVEEFRREESYPLPNEHETFWVDGAVGTQVRTSDVLVTSKVKSETKPTKVCTIIEICTKTMQMSVCAQKRKCWKALPPITIETGYDLLTEAGRDRAFKELKRLRLDLIVAEWMCDPWSNIQTLTLLKVAWPRNMFIRNVPFINTC